MLIYLLSLLLIYLYVLLCRIILVAGISVMSTVRGLWLCHSSVSVAFNDAHLEI